jgi:hypothetical protein
MKNEQLSQQQQQQRLQEFTQDGSAQQRKHEERWGPLQIRPGDVSGDVSDDVSERENPDYFPLRDQNRARPGEPTHVAPRAEGPDRDDVAQSMRGVHVLELG